MKRNNIIIWAICIFTPFFSLGQNGAQSPGIVNLSINKNAPAETMQWGKLVGNWDIVFEDIDVEGNVLKSYIGEWNWFYILNGHAIQDVFVLPPRTTKMDNPENRFYGTGMKIFNPENKKWQSIWIDTSGKQFEMREAYSIEEGISLLNTKDDGSKVRITYFDIAKDSFEWRQEVSDDGGKNWVMNQAIHAKKRVN